MGLSKFFDFDQNKGWKKGRFYKQRKFDNDFMSVRVPWYELSQFNGQCAIIINGRQLIIKKLPKNKEYFIDKNLGMYEINHKNSFFLNKCEIFFYDVRNQNSFDPGVAHELYKWANNQGMYKIRRVDVKHAIRLRTLREKYQQKKNAIMHKITLYQKEKNEIELEKAKQELYELETMPEQELSIQLNEEKKDQRKFVGKVIAEIDHQNQATEKQRELDRGDPNSDEYHVINEDEVNYLITKNLFENGYIDGNQRRNLDFKLTRKEIKSTDDLLTELDSFTDLYVTEPITHEMERFLDDYHTYNPRNVVMHISALSKVRNGINKLRTKAVYNFFPAMYILFGCLGIGIIYVLYSQYASSGVDAGALIPGT